MRSFNAASIKQAYDEIADAVVQRRAAILSPSQCEILLREWRRLQELARHAYEEGKG